MAPRFRDSGGLRTKGSGAVIRGRSAQNAKPRDHEIGLKPFYDLAGAKIDGLAVRVTFENGGPVQVERLDEQGKAVAAPPAATTVPAQPVASPPAPVAARGSARPATASTSGGPRLATARSFPIPGAGGSFVPADNFVPLVDRQTLPVALQDLPTRTHGRHLPDHYTGTIAVTITTRTPLLLPDQSRATPSRVDGEDVTVLPTRVTPKRKPILDGSAIEGMLRASYVAVTASRFVVFGRHSEPLAARANAQAGATYNPAVVTKEDGDLRELTVLKHLLPRGFRSRGDVNQVWVPRAKFQHLSPNLGPSMPLDTPELDAWIQLVWHDGDRKEFCFWQVVSAVRRRQTLPPQPTCDLVGTRITSSRAIRSRFGGVCTGPTHRSR
jgi:hypothetical protein